MHIKKIKMDRIRYEFYVSNRLEYSCHTIQKRNIKKRKLDSKRIVFTIKEVKEETKINGRSTGVKHT